MVIWFKQSLKKRNAEKAERQTQRDEIAELQDAMIEIAGLVETMSADTADAATDKEAANG